MTERAYVMNWRFAMKFKTDSDLSRAVNEYRLSYNKVNEDNRAALIAVAKTGRKALYKNLAVGYGLRLAMREPANANAVAQLLTSRHIAAATGKTNPFYPLVRAVYGEFKDEAAVSSDWNPNRSAEKYANVFRLAEARKITVEGFADWLLNFKDELGNGMAGAEKRDRRDNGANNPALEAEIDRDIQVVLTRKLGTLPMPSNVAHTTDKYVCVWGKVEGKQFIAHGVLPTMSGTVERYLRAEASQLSTVIAKEKTIADAKSQRRSQPEAVTA
jgi:hypothetical protein